MRNLPHKLFFVYLQIDAIIPGADFNQNVSILDLVSQKL